MQNIGRIKSLFRYPVKSLLGENCQQIQVEERGFYGDRLYAIVDQNGKFGSGKNTRRFRKIDGLLDTKATFENNTPTITFSDGKEISGDDPAISQILSDAFGQSLSLDIESGTSHFDASAIHIITSSSLEWLKSMLPNSSINELRFRPNICIQTDGSEFCELDWIGKTLKIGDVELEVRESTERCIMTTLPQKNLPSDPDILRCIAQELSLNFGVYAKVIKTGEISTNIPVFILD